MNQIIKPESIDFNLLINQNTTLNIDSKTKMLEILKNEFTPEELRWFVANLLVYTTYHQTADFPINLDTLVKLVDFANKQNAKRTLVNNFTEGIDYKILLIPKDEQVKTNGGAGLNKEKVMMNIDTFKNMCMLVKTEKSKEIRRYYVKLENIYNKIIKEEIDMTQKLLEENKQLLLKQQEHIAQLENKPELEGFIRKEGYIYLIKDNTKPGHYKIGFAEKPDKRLSQLNCGSSTFALQLVSRFKTFDKIYAEKIIHYALFPFKISKANEWFYLSNNLELAYTIKTIKDCISFIEKYDIKDLVTFKESNKYFDIQKELSEISNEISLQEQIVIDKKDLQNKICTQQGQQMKNRTGIYKGVHWKEDKKKWTTCLKKDYKNIFLGYHETELEGAKAYNDYAVYLNQNENTKYLLNEIPNYEATPRDIPNETKIIKTKIIETKSSDFNGVSYWKQRKYFVVSIKLNSKTYNLGHNENEIECAKLYNQQALYFNETLATTYELNIILNYITISKNIIKDIQDLKKLNKTSKYIGVSFNKQTKKYKSFVVCNKKQLHIGFFENELQAAKAYNTKVIELNTEFNKKYKLNQI